ncbi:MAG: penicillin-binding transpeptidase domain-containing protein, partial [Glaciimonas sp.]|nr:penicillin-binding transpeptidase domain-containing protein [Glaciimonas sp.]
THSGTAARVFANAGYESGGKTGTSQVFTVKQDAKYEAHKIGERLRDHALYTAFAPADKPRIAIAVIVENGGFGAAAAAPIVRKALDYYLLGKRPGDKANAKATAAKTATAKAEIAIDTPDDLSPIELPSDDGTYKDGAETAGNRE